MNEAPSTELQRYLVELRDALRAMPETQADDLVREIESHVRDAATIEGSFAPHRVADSLQKLGDPGKLAEQFLLDDLAHRAERSRSPWLLLQAATRAATYGLSGIWMLLVGCIGYWISLVALACAIAKPFFFDRVGLWVSRTSDDDLNFQLGRVAVAPLDAQEVLGWTIIPIGLALGVAAFTLTTLFLVRRARAMRRRSKR